MTGTIEMGNFNSPKLQDFSLPKPIIRYITKNPTTFDYYRKIVKTCKYFYSNFMIFAFLELKFVKDCKWPFCIEFNCKSKHEFNLFDMPVKIWLTKNLIIEKKSKLYPNLISSLISKVHRCDITKLVLYHQTITFEEFLYLTPNVDYFAFIHGYIKENNGNDLHLKKIVENIPKLQYLYYRFNDESSDITADTVKNLLQLNSLKNFKHFDLYMIPEIFNFKSFSDFMNKNKQISFKLIFRHLLSDNYKLQIEAYKDEIKNEKFEGVDPPKIEISE